MSVRELARRIDRSPSAVSQVETGQLAPSAAMMSAIGTQLAIDPDDLSSWPVATAVEAPHAAPARSSNREHLRADARRNRDALLEAASELFAQQGLKVSVSEIADRADVTVATLHRHFPTKRHLIEEISRQRVTAVETLVERALATEDVSGAITRAFEDIITMQAKDRGLVQLIEAAISVELHKEMIAGWAELLRRAQSAGVVRDDVTGEDIPFLLAGCGGVARLLTDASPSLRRRYARLLVDCLRPGNETPLGSKPPTIRQVEAAHARLDTS